MVEGAIAYSEEWFHELCTSFPKTGWELGEIVPLQEILLGMTNNAFSTASDSGCFNPSGPPRNISLGCAEGRRQKCD